MCGLCALPQPSINVILFCAKVLDRDEKVNSRPLFHECFPWYRAGTRFRVDIWHPKIRNPKSEERRERLTSDVMPPLCTYYVHGDYDFHLPVCIAYIPHKHFSWLCYADVQMVKGRLYLYRPFRIVCTVTAVDISIQNHTQIAQARGRYLFLLSTVCSVVWKPPLSTLSSSPPPHPASRSLTHHVLDTRHSLLLI